MMPAHALSPPHRVPTATLALGGLLGPVAFAAVVAVAAALEPGYSHVAQAISELGGVEATRPLLQNANFLATGVLTLAFAAALAQRFPAHRGAAALVALFALSSTIANGLLPCDAGCAGRTPVGLAHNVTGMAGFVAAIAGMLRYARVWRTEAGWERFARFTAGAGFVALAGLVGFVVTKAAALESVDGLLQRVFVAAFLLWIFATAWRLRREAVAEESEGAA